MKFNAAIDISTFIWCEKDFNDNKDQYMILKNLAPIIYSQIQELQLPVILRAELYDLIMNKFPYNVSQEIGYEFERFTFEFLSNTVLNWISYNDNGDLSILSMPELKKLHFCNDVKAETQSQINHLYTNKHPDQKFIAYDYFFNQNNNLVLSKEQNSIEIDTLSYKSEKEINEFFDNYRLKFEHNPKHRKVSYFDYERSENVSPFSCFHNQGQVAAQNLLNNSISYKDSFFNYDLENNVFVRFIKTSKLIYHGHDIFDEGNNIPNEIKKKFPK